MKKNLILAVLALLLMASPAMAKEGLYLGANILVNDFSGDLDYLDTGSGLGLRAGIGVGRYFAIEGGLFQTNHEYGGNDADFSAATIDAKLILPLTGSKMEPYLFLGVGRYELSNGGTFKGNGTQFGVGVDIYLFPELSLNVGFTKRDITFDEGVPAGDLDADVRTVDFGLTYHFL